MKGILKMWGIIRSEESRYIQEVTSPMVPTAGPGDSGDGWVKERRGDGWSDVREARITPPPADEKGQWEEGSVGVWHKKGS